MVAACTGSLLLMGMTLGLAFSLNGLTLRIHRWGQGAINQYYLSFSGDSAHL